MNRSVYKMFSVTMILALMLVALPMQSAGAATPTELFFSEYIEGTSFNKALEIYNGTGAPVDLTAGAYSVQVFFNGNATAGLTLNLNGVVADGDVYVVANSNSTTPADPAILAQADLISLAGFYNGDDAVVLRKNGVIIDVIGQIGFDPGSEWGTGNTSTADNTLRRKGDICNGDPDGTNAFDPSLEWDGFATNTFDGLGTHTVSCGDDISPVINEFVANHVSTDTNEYVEIFGNPSTDYSSLTILQLEGDGTGAGVVDSAINVGTTDAGGFWTTGFFGNEFENGAITLLLVEGFTGSEGADLDTNNDGVLDSTPWTQLLDDVAVSDGGPGDRHYSSVVLAPGFGGSSFTPGGASRIPNGVDTDSIADWTLNDFDLYGIPGFTGTQQIGEAINTPGATNEVITVIVDPFGACFDPATMIHTIQGSGAASSDVGNVRAVEAVVVATFQDTNEIGGYFIQEEDADVDANPLTSEGLRIFDNANTPSVGDVIRIRGSVTEFNGLTELTNILDFAVCGTGVATPATLSLPVTSVSDFEAYEGMLVTFPQALYISEYFNFDRFNEIVLTSERHLTPTAEFEPGAPAIQAAQEFLLDKITLDDGRGNQNPDPAIHPNGDAFDLDNLFRGGDTVANVTGVMDFAFGLYRIQPTQGADYTSENPRPIAPDDVGGNLKVASFNVLNYFTTLDDGVNDICGPAGNQECRGADNAEELTRQRAKIISALTAMNADVVGLIEIENHPGDVPTADLVSGLNDVFGAGTYDYIATGAIGTDAIRLAFIYKPATVTPLGAYAILDSSVDPRFLDGFNRPVLAQTFQDNSTGGVVTVAVNHLKSKGSDCNAIGDPDTGDGSGNCNLTRKAAAEALVDWLASDPTGSGDIDYLIIGDLNSYDKEEPIDAILKGSDDTLGTVDDYTDLLYHFIGEFAYSYVFDGQLGYLDHALASSNLMHQVTGATVWHINADEPDLIDYDTSFKGPNQDAIYAPDAYRSSDHDPVIVGLDLTHYDFAGFLPPVESPPAVNLVNAGSVVPIKFNLSGDQGLDVFADGYPALQFVSCDTFEHDGSEIILSAGGAGLHYDPALDEYTYAWKTRKNWAGMCGRLLVIFDDGMIYTALFEFTK